MQNDSLHFVFAGGGTGGHLFPGLAVATQLRTIVPAARITFATGSKSLEREQIAAAGFEQLRLPARPLPRGPASVWPFVAENLRAYRVARRFLRDHGATVVIGLGGYASAAMARAAAAARIPLVLLEQNAIAGRATRWLAPKASLVCAAFEEVRSQLKAAGPIRITGNPIRAGFLTGSAHARNDVPGPRRLLILGGSGGARSLNEQVPRALYKLRNELRGWRIVHQTGRRDQAATAQLYGKLALKATVVAFIDQLPPLLRNSDLAVCRAGGTTLAELAAAGVPSVLLPYPRAADDHQRKNADVFADAGAARIVDEREIAGRLDNALATELADLLLNSQLRDQLAAAMRSRARPDAAWQVATMICQLAGAEQFTAARAA